MEGVISKPSCLNYRISTSLMPGGEPFFESWSRSKCVVSFSCTYLFAADNDMRNVKFAFSCSHQVGSGLQGFQRGVRLHACACMSVSSACVYIDLILWRAVLVSGSLTITLCATQSSVKYMLNFFIIYVFM